MIITPHLLAGAAIGSQTDNYWLAAVLALISHFILDVIPHAEYDIPALKRKIKGRRKLFFDLAKIGVDFSLGFLMIIFLTKNYTDVSYILTGMFFGILPDIFSFLGFVFNSRFLKTLYKYHNALHIFRNKHVPKWIKYASQIAVVLAAIWVIK